MIIRDINGKNNKNSFDKAINFIFQLLGKHIVSYDLEGKKVILIGGHEDYYASTPSQSLAETINQVSIHLKQCANRQKENYINAWTHNQFFPNIFIAKCKKNRPFINKVLFLNTVMHRNSIVTDFTLIFEYANCTVIYAVSQQPNTTEIKHLQGNSHFQVLPR